MTDDRKGYPRQINDAYELLPLDAVKPHPRNPRRGDLDAIKASMDVNGFYGAIVANKRTGYILAGNHRWMAARMLELPEIPVLWVDVGEAEARRILAADNRTGDLGGYDDAVLASLLQGLQDDGGLLGTGYSGDDLDDLLSGLIDLDDDSDSSDEAPAPAIDKAKELQSKWKTARGQIWQVGAHRLMCGDCKDETDLTRLLNGATVGAVVTDPPYGINANRQTLGIGKREFHRGDSWDLEAPDPSPWLDLAPQVIIWGGNYFADRLPRSADWLVWHKKNDGRSFAEVELAWTNLGCNARHLAHHWSGEIKQHPTAKPLPVMEWCVGLTEGIVLDLFAGSGTTGIAAERCGRSSLLIDMDPVYLAVQLQRFADTGLTPSLVEDAP